ncbi:reverse transcriptase [Labeo rohita]|uniref:Reverse transcriptase n=1 Tax=Labeo rohita TaxID=84645 RepID=A0A498LY13_LABRO|nr:reverse transcriptase [Labeo rohita]
MGKGQLVGFVGRGLPATGGDMDKYRLAGTQTPAGAIHDREPVSPVPGLTLSEAKQVWRNAAHPALQNRHKDLSWMAAHEILPVRAVMHSRGMAKNPTCPRSGCNFPETVRHLLWECGAARDLWAKPGPLYFPCLPAGGAQIGYQLAILGVGRGLKDLTAQDFNSLWLTLNVIKDAIWATRNLLVGKRVTVPLHACELKDREPVSPVPGLTLSEAKQVWRNAAHPALQNRHKDLSWMAAHEILPVRAVMHSRGMAKNPTCPRSGCNFPETVRHLLWECGAARDLWAKTGPLYFPCLPAGGAQIGYQLAILGVGRGLKDLTAQDFTSLWLTLTVIKDAIWATRNLLVGKRVTVPLHACELKDREPVSPVPGLTLSEAKQVWRNAAHPALQNRHKDLSWMAAHEILPVRAVMHSRGMAKNPTCPRSGCNFPETVRHLLWECGAARDLWAKTGPLYFPCLPAGGAQIGYQLAILGVGRGLKDLTAQEFTSLWLPLNVIKDAIWATRNLLVGKRVTVPLHACELKVTSMLQGYRATIFGRGGRGRTERVPAATVAGRP